MSITSYSVNRTISRDLLNRIKSYLDMPSGEVIGVDLNAKDGAPLRFLTQDAATRSLYGSTEFINDMQNIEADDTFRKIFNTKYDAEGRMTREVFSIGIADPHVEFDLYTRLYASASKELVEKPNFEERARKTLASFGFTDESVFAPSTTANPLSNEEQFARVVENEKTQYRKEIILRESRFSTIRHDIALLNRTTERLMPGGVLVFLISKEMLDRPITSRLVAAYEDLRFLKPADEFYKINHKIVVIGKKRKVRLKKAKNPYEELFLTPIEQFELLEEQVGPLYQVPASNHEKVSEFRLGPLTNAEASIFSKKSSLFANAMEKFPQISTSSAPTAPAPLKQGHIMMLLTSGYLNGYIGEGPNKHLVKGSTTKLRRSVTEYDYDKDANITKEREFFNVRVKLLNRNGEFKTLQ